MHLTPKDEDRLLLFCAAELARRRQARGLALSYPEARALIADEVVEAARDGATVPEAAAVGARVLTEDDLLPGVAALIGTVQVEGFFDDGQKLVTIHDPVRPGTRTATDESQPGEVLVAEGEIELNTGRTTAAITVVNTGDRPIQVGSHFHFFEVNRALRFDRRSAYGMHLDIPAGTAVRFEPGEEHDVALVALGGSREVHGLNDLTGGPLEDGLAESRVERMLRAGFLDSTSS